MLENMNDYLSIVAIAVVLAMIVVIFVYFWNLRAIQKNVRKEVKYYGYEKRKPNNQQ